jgi:hypothetical protein
MRVSIEADLHAIDNELWPGHEEFDHHVVHVKRFGIAPDVHPGRLRVDNLSSNTQAPLIDSK